MRPYKVLVTHEILSLSRPPAGQRQKIISFLESLSGSPSQIGDYEEKDDIGRPVQIKVLVTFSFWADHAVSEVKVTRIERADKR